MSIQNILVDNNLKLFCENLQVDDQITNQWGNVPGIAIINHQVPLYYNNVFIVNLNCIFIRISAGLIPGLCYMIIPSTSIFTQSVYDNYYLDLSSFTDVLIGSSVVVPYLVVDNSNQVFGVANCSQSTQHISFSPGASTSGKFQIGNSGFSYPGYIVYSQKFL